MVARRLNQAESLQRDHFAILGLSWAGWLFDFYDLILYSFLLVPVAREFGFTREESSLVLGVSLGCTALGGIIFGRLADRFGRKAVLQWTILSYSSGVLLSGLATGLWTLLAARVVTAVGVGGEWATGQTLVSETFPAAQRGHYGALMQTGAPLGVGLAAVMGSFFAPAFGWRTTFIASALPALLVTLIRKYMPESDVWEARRAQPSQDGGGFTALLRPPVRQFTGWCLLLTALNMSAYWFTYSWLPAYLVAERHLGIADSGLWILIIVLGELLGYGSFGWFADRFGRKPVFTVFAFVMAAGLLMITLFWRIIEGQPALILMFMLLVGFGTGTWSMFGPFFAELFPTAIRNTAIGSIFNVARGVQFFTPLVITAVARHADLSAGIALAAAFAIGAGLTVWTLPETRGREISE
ncbi:MAG TPA: MFS transporter [Candidatus Margulisiibacteriota bacterium]|nr:MFS transporter [Candidatus Margulisiibacteriota bacterium]